MKFYQLIPPLRQIEAFCPTGTVCALGLFDSVHAGHRALLLQTARLAQSRGLTSCVFAFADGAYKNGDAPLYPLETRLALMAQCGIEYAAIAEFQAVRHLSPEQFVQQILGETLHAAVAVSGSDFRFGRDGEGTVTRLQTLMQAMGADAVCVPPVRFGTSTDADLKLHRAAYAACSLQCTPISTSVIRQMLQQGDVESAAVLLQRPFAMTARVVSGHQIGRTLGFPTANLPLPWQTSPLRNGVYVCRCRRADQTVLGGICNLGSCPTVRQGEVPHLEVYLFCEDAPDLYGQALTVEFLHFLRPERRFDSLDALQREIEANVAQAKAYLCAQK